MNFKSCYSIYKTKNLYQLIMHLARSLRKSKKHLKNFCLLFFSSFLYGKKSRSAVLSFCSIVIICILYHTAPLHANLFGCRLWCARPQVQRWGLSNLKVEGKAKSSRHAWSVCLACGSCQERTPPCSQKMMGWA